MYFKSIFVFGAFCVATVVGAISTQDDNLTKQDGKKPKSTQKKSDSRKQDGNVGKKKDLKKLKGESLLGAIHVGFSHANLRPDQTCSSCHQTHDQDPHHSPYFLEIFSNGKKGKGVDVSFLGVNASDVPSAVRSHLSLDDREGTLVKNVVDESPAYHCGIEKHDVLLAIDKQPIVGEKGLLETIRSKKPGTKIMIEFIRRGRKNSCNLVLGKQTTAEMIKSFQIHGCKAELTASTKCQDCHGAASK